MSLSVQKKTGKRKKRKREGVPYPSPREPVQIGAADGYLLDDPTGWGPKRHPGRCSLSPIVKMPSYRDCWNKQNGTDNHGTDIVRCIFAEQMQSQREAIKIEGKPTSNTLAARVCRCCLWLETSILSEFAVIFWRLQHGFWLTGGFSSR